MSTNQVPELSYFFSTSLALIFIICIVGNTLILVLVYKREVFGDGCQGRLLIRNMAIIDLISSLDCLTCTIGYVNIKLITGVDILCKIEGFRQWVTKPFSQLSFLLLSLSRFYAVTRPHTVNDTFTRRRCIIAITCGAIGTLITGLCLGWATGFTASVTPDGSSCFLTGKLTKRVSVGFGFCLILTISVINIRTWWSYRMQEREVQPDSVNAPNNLPTNGITKAILLIVSYYLLSSVPFVAQFLVKNAFPME